MNDDNEQDGLIKEELLYRWHERWEQLETIVGGLGCKPEVILGAVKKLKEENEELRAVENEYGAHLIECDKLLSCGSHNGDPASGNCGECKACYWTKLETVEKELAAKARALGLIARSSLGPDCGTASFMWDTCVEIARAALMPPKDPEEGR